MTNGMHDLAEEPIPRLVRALAVPAGVGFFFNTMFNVVDTWYAGFISSSALAAMTLSFPLFFIIIAIGGGISAGSTALIGHAIGMADQEKAAHYSLQTLSFALLHGLLLAMAGSLSAPLLLPFMGASGAYLELARTYIVSIYWAAPFFILNYACNAILTASGDTAGFRNFLVVGFILNMILDPWFLFGGFGVPPLGLRGIAWSTVAIQAFGTCYLSLRTRKTGLLPRLSPAGLLPSLRTYLHLARLGFPASLNMLTIALGFFVITWFMARFSASAVAAYGIATRIEQTVMLPVMGLNSATLTLVARNFGARNFDRIRETIHVSMSYGLAMTLVATVLVWTLADPLVGMFTQDPAVAEIGGRYLRIECLVFCAYIILYLSVSALQGLQRPMYPLGIGIYRQFAAPVIVFPLLTNHLGFGLQGLWWGIFIVNWSAAAFTLFYLGSLLKELVSQRP